MWWGWGQERKEIAAGKRWRPKALNSLGVPFFIRSMANLFARPGEERWPKWLMSVNLRFHSGPSVCTGFAAARVFIEHLLCARC